MKYLVFAATLMLADPYLLAMMVVLGVFNLASSE
jgi:hypothetical protein